MRIAAIGKNFVLLLACLAVALLAPAAQAAPFVIDDGGRIPDEARGISVDEHLGSSLPLDLVFKDEQGKAVTLRQYFTGRKPVVLQIGYFGCPMLCGLVSQGLVKSLKDVTLTAGTDFEVVYVSIDPTETPELAAGKKQSYLGEYNRPGSEGGFHFLVGTEKNAAELAKAAGFQYRLVPGTQQYVHAAVLMVCSPEGKLTRYLYGVNYDPQTVRLSLVEGSDGKVGTTVDRFILTCFRYDGHQGKYALFAINLMKIGGGLTVVSVASVLGWLHLRDSRRLSIPAGKASPMNAESLKSSDDNTFKSI